MVTGTILLFVRVCAASFHCPLYNAIYFGLHPGKSMKPSLQPLDRFRLSSRLMSSRFVLQHAKA